LVVGKTGSGALAVLGMGRSKSGSVVVAVSVTPQSTPIALLVAGKGSTCSFTTKLAHHFPVASR
jgi:hypothetical protein